jgi:nucleotide-binding universal stress UspA family protein
VSITVFTTVDRGQESLAAEYLESIATYFGKARVLPKVVINSRPGEAILEEAARGYDLLVMGTPQEGGTQTEVFSPLIDYIARLSPCPVIFVRGPKGDESWNGRFERILVPTNGSQASTRAADLAFALTDTSLGLEHIFLLKVVESMEVDYSSAIVERQLEYARAHVAELKEAGRMMGAVVEGVVDVGPSPEQVIVAFAKRQQIDLIILGISARAGAERLFLGPRVERILGAAPCPVLVLNG